MKKFLLLFTVFIWSAFAQDEFLIQGMQSKISLNSFLNEISTLKGKSDLKTIKNILKWKRDLFKGKSAQGKLIGKRTVESIYKSKFISGCHDDALVVASVARELGIPSIMVEATGIDWSRAFIAKESDTANASGHVFIELFLDGKWKLLDSSYEKLITDYDRENFSIPITHQGQKSGYYVMGKSIDTWSLGVRALKDLLSLQVKFAEKASSIIMLRKYKIIKL